MGSPRAQRLDRRAHQRRIDVELESRLDSIPGVGDVKRKPLLRAFGSVHGVKAASVEQLAALPSIGMELARTIVE
ncbi:MAG: excinuclease ABC subunit C, partial [Planctomycetota bacterium]